MAALPSDWAPQRVEYFDTHWYEAVVKRVNVEEKTVEVAFPDNIWQPRTVQASVVRSAPAQAMAPPDPPIAAGDRAEVQQIAEGVPPYWVAAEVRKIKASFYYVWLTAGSMEVIVEDKQVRRTAEETPSMASMMENVHRATVVAPSIVNTWISSRNAQGCFGLICSQSGLLSITPNPDVPGELILHGTDETIHKAKIRLEIHLEHQASIQIFQENRQSKLDHLEELRDKLVQLESLFHEEVEVPADHAAKVVQQGTKYGVQIQILPEYVERMGPGRLELRRVRVSGETREDVRKVIDEIKYVEIYIPVPSDQFGYLLGKNGENINDMQSKSGVLVANLQRGEQKLQLYGVQQAVDAAKDLVEAHLVYHPIFTQMHEEQVVMRNAMHEITGNSHFDKGKRKDKGKGKDYR